MALPDYSDYLERLHRALGRAWERNHAVLDVPGASWACRVDQNYYLAVEPILVEGLSRASAMTPDSVRQTLLRTGAMLSRRAEPDMQRSPSDAESDTESGSEPGREHILSLRLEWPGRDPGQLDRPLPCVFLLADFVEQALRMYAGADPEPGLSELRIAAAERDRVEAFFAGKTAPAPWVYAGA